MTTTDYRDGLRATIAEWVEAYRNGAWDGDRTPQDFLRDWSNDPTASVDAAGDCHVRGAYLGAERLDQFVAWLLDQKAI